MISYLLSAAVAAVLSSQVAAGLSNATLPPVKPWVVHFDDTECYAERDYGTPQAIALGLRPAPSGDSFELLLARNGATGRFAQQLEGSVDFGQGPAKAWLLRYQIKGREYRVDKFRIAQSVILQARAASAVTFHVRGEGEVRLALAALPGVLKTLEQCNEDLQHYWNMTSAEAGRVVTPPVGDVRGVFSYKDYPDEAASRQQGGSVKLLLFVNEKGAVANCHVIDPSGVPALDGMACQVARERMKFKPAIDAQGRPIRTAIETPPIIWRIED